MVNTKTMVVLQVVISFIYYGVVTGTNCKDGWMAYHNSCYLFARNHASTFTEAEHYCRQHGGNLVTIETKAENLFIRDYLRGLKDEHHWLGLTDEMVEGIWKWYSTNTDATYTDWNPGEPNSAGGEEDCAILAYNQDYRWLDVSCISSWEPICEIESGEVDIVG
ncbi:lactose-binding lectin l-2-like [Mercenaria mercenaria]|uniref:lactose-binding lectin l-2-like n=1 Tax=Mercenaria mercenaria TaxID=6596 RepID=UPI00234E4056|nr:lactose-binding lectin l-2-like [Mercenaria mercenaria]